MMTKLTKFTINVPQSKLDDLQSRLLKTIWPNEIAPATWHYGPTVNYIERLVNRWRTSFDWRAQEVRLNRHPQFVAEIDSQTIHFIHVRSTRRSSKQLLLLHGWPGSVIEYLDVIQPLIEPNAHGAESGDAFDVVIPSLPGYGFSGPAREAGWNDERMGGLSRINDRARI